MPVHVANPDQLKAKLEKMRLDGMTELQIISDFDGTLTYHYSPIHPGKKALSCHGLIGQYPGFPSEFRAANQALYNQYSPIEKDPNLPETVRSHAMNEWWTKSHELMISQSLSLERIDEIVRDAVEFGVFGLRPHAADFISLARQLRVPLLIVSAGISVVIEELLSLERIARDDLTVVVSNDTVVNKQGILVSFVEPLIHGFTKREAVCNLIAESVTRSDKGNIIVLGDMPQDADVLESVKKKKIVISIGFLMDTEHLAEYMELYDVVLTGCEGFEYVVGLLNLVAS